MSSFDRINPKLIDVVLRAPSGYPAHLAAEDTPSNIRLACGSAARDFPKHLWIEPKDWADKARDNDKYGTWPMNYVDRFTNQSPSHECTCQSLIANCTGARNRMIGVRYPDGPKKNFRYEESGKYGSVFLSPLSVYAEANPNEWGGANVRRVMEIACQRGILPDKVQPREYGFKHVLQGTSGRGNGNQSGGKWISMREFPEGWQETAALFKPDEVVFPDSWEQAVCLVLHGVLISVGRNNHAIPWAKWMAKEQAMAYPDSYDIVRYDSLRTVKQAWRGSFGVVTMTAPDNWLDPAGVAA